MAKNMLLQDGTIAIRPYQPQDAAEVYAAIRESLPDVSFWLQDLHADLTPTDIVAYIDTQPEAWDNGQAYNFVITTLDDETFLGGCGLTQINSKH